MDTFFDDLWLYIKLLLLTPIFMLGATIVMFVIGGVITGASNVGCNMCKEYNIAKDLVYDTCYWGDYCSIRCYYCNNKYKH